MVPLKCESSFNGSRAHFFPSGRDCGIISAKLEGNARVVKGPLYVERENDFKILPLLPQVFGQVPVGELPPLFPAPYFCLPSLFA